MKRQIQAYMELVKTGIIIFVVICTLAGFALSYRIEQSFSVARLLSLLIGIALLSAGSFALNQWQEVRLDSLMPRTRRRPLVTGVISLSKALVLSILFLVLGSVLLYLVSPLSSVIGGVTVLLYNYFYTLHWKPKSSFGAVPGAIPGAMPVVIGYAANSSNIFSTECIYAFLIMFLWQMPHYWALAIRYEEDYRAAGIPVLPVAVGASATSIQIGLYTSAYVMLALFSPWFVDFMYLYYLLVVPFALKVAWECYKFYGSKARWLRFFLWTNLSMLIFLLAPVIDKWHIVMTAINS